MKIRAFVLGAVAILLFGCSADDGNSGQQLEINAQNLMGKWYLKGGTANDGPFEDYDNECPTHRDYQEFVSSEDLMFHGANYLCEEDIEMSKWYLDGNELTVFSYLEGYIDYQDTYIIESLTSEQLVLKQTVNEPEGVFVYKIYATRH